MGKTEKVGRPRHGKKFSDNIDDFETPPIQGRRNRHYPENKSKTVGKTHRNPVKDNYGRKNHHGGEYEDHRKFLMPEMNDFIDDGGRQSYLT